MPAVELLMPKMGESIMEATVLSWLKNVGDTVDIDEPVLEIATDKVDSEVPSEVAGTITEILFQEGDVVPVGQAVAIIQTEGDAAAPVIESTPSEIAKPVAAATAIVEKAVETTAPIAASEGNRFYSPLVINIAKEEGIAMTELETVAGTGKEGRVTKKDILTYVKNRTGAPTTTTTQAAVQKTTSTPTPVVAKSNTATTSVSGNVEIVEMDRMRKLIADHMVNSKKTSAHVTSFVEADVTKIVK
ncbi:MAG: biotin/lipoyl-containing protein, partial [Chitinophagales bacterium]